MARLLLVLMAFASAAGFPPGPSVHVGVGLHIPDPDPAVPLEPCFDPLDATDCIQAALDRNSSGPVSVHIADHDGQPWVVRPLWIRRSNLVVSLAPDVVLLAKSGAFKGTGKTQCLQGHR